MDAPTVRPEAAAVGVGVIDDPPHVTAPCPGPRCKAQVIWAVDDKTLIRIPVDPDPVPDGDVKLMRRLDANQQERLVAHVCTKKELITTSWGLVLRRRHLTVCIDARRPTVRSRRS